MTLREFYLMDDTRFFCLANVRRTLVRYLVKLSPFIHVGGYIIPYSVALGQN
jgi:hypothetical protein